eukprot:3562289-Rhodomonas_salina.1
MLALPLFMVALLGFFPAGSPGYCGGCAFRHSVPLSLPMPPLSLPAPPLLLTPPPLYGTA